MKLFTFIAFMLVCSSSFANFVSNGSFELGSFTGGQYETLSAGSTAITGWTVTGATIDWVDSSYWQASNGTKSLDLTGTPGAGGVEQTLSLTPGTRYKLTFDFSGNQDAGAGRYALNVKVGNLNSFAFYNTGTEGNSRANMKYKHFSANFVAGSTNILSFRSLNQGNQGPVLDNVAVQSVPEPMTMGVLALGLTGLLARRKKS